MLSSNIPTDFQLDLKFWPESIKDYISKRSELHLYTWRNRGHDQLRRLTVLHPPCLFDIQLAPAPCVHRVHIRVVPHFVATRTVLPRFPCFMHWCWCFLLSFFRGQSIKKQTCSHWNLILQNKPKDEWTCFLAHPVSRDRRTDNYHNLHLVDQHFDVSFSQMTNLKNINALVIWLIFTLALPKHFTQTVTYYHFRTS